MSEEIPICPKCGKPLTQCQCSVITLKHEGLPEKQSEIEKLREEKEALESIVQISAVTQFENEKKAFLNQIHDEDKRAEIEDKIGDDPNILEDYKRMADFFTTQLRKSGVKVTGEDDEYVRSPPIDSGIPPYVPSGDDSYKKVVDGLYNILLDDKKTQAEKDEANKKLDQLFFEMFKGIKRTQKMPFLSVSQCPQCGTLLGANARSCKRCGWQYLIPKR